jgi:hypothetical protein
MYPGIPQGRIPSPRFETDLLPVLGANVEAGILFGVY